MSALVLFLVVAIFVGCGAPPKAAPSPVPTAVASTAPPSTATPSTPSANASPCSRTGVTLQVLGSGGPIPDDDRASSSYLIWHRGKARALVDVGGGTFVRFGASGAKIADLDVVALSHLHADHAAGLPALLKGGYFAERKRKLVVLGPSANERFPALDEHLERLLDPKQGAFRYLSGYLSGEGLFPLDVRVVDAAGREAKTVFEGERLSIEAVGVHHGVIPAIGYLVTIDGLRIAFGGDQSADNAAFEKLITGADLLVAHHALPERGFDGVTHLHRTPSQIGELAAGAGVKRLVLSHHMQRALRDLDAGLKAIRSHYDGPIEVADDLSCYPLVVE